MVSGTTKALILASAAMLVCGVAAQPSQPRRTVLATGWDVSGATLDEILESADLFAATPIDGIAFSIRVADKKGKSYASGHPAESPFVWTKEMLAGDVPKLRKMVSHKGLAESVVAILYHPAKRIAWDDDARWTDIAATMRSVAWAAKQGGVRGFLFDPEDYHRQNQFSRLPGEPPYETLAATVRARARQLFGGVFAEHPDATVLSYWLMSFAMDYAKTANIRAAAAERNDLWPAFVEGMVEAAPPGVRLVDGCENAYRYEAAYGQFTAAAAMQRSMVNYVLPENRSRYRSQVDVGFGMWMGMYLPKGSRRPETEEKWRFLAPCEKELRRFADNLEQALDASDGYVWLYNASERTSWIPWRAKRFAKWGQWEKKMPGITDVVRALKDPDCWLEAQLAKPGVMRENLVPPEKRQSKNLADGEKYKMHIVHLDVKPGEFYGVRARIAGDDIQPIVRWRRPGEKSRPFAVPSVPISFREPYAGKTRVAQGFARVPIGVTSLDFVVRAEPSKIPAVVEDVEIWKMLASCDEAIGITTEGRVAFRRGESPAAVRLKVKNTLNGGISGARMIVEQLAEERCVRKQDVALGDLSAGAETVVPCAIETRVRPGWHLLRVTLTGRKGDGSDLREAHDVRMGIGPRLGDRMTALMWGFNAPVGALAEFGFSHGLTRSWTPKTSDLALYDEALVAGIGLVHPMSAEFQSGKDGDAYVRKDRTGKVIDFGGGSKGVEVSNPELLQAMKPIIDEDVRMNGGHPAFVGVLPSSEQRDLTAPSFNTEHLRYKNETGRDVPPEADGRTIAADRLDEFKRRYPDGVVPKDDPVLSYYRWFWKGGDGWPAYTGGIADMYRRGISRSDFFVFWDPAVRCPPIWGSGGAVDMLNQWVYAIPEPMNVAGPAEEILAMVAGRPGQLPSIMTQLICYRSQMAPMEKKVSPEPEWVKRRPKARFPTIPPDILQESTWSMIAKPVQAIMYHGWGTIYETGSTIGYVYTNPESADRLRHLLKDVVSPLGPTLKRLGRAAQPVALLESFTTCALGGPSSRGWKAPSITFLQRARLDPRVVYEETILRDGLDGVKVLYAPQCIFLTPDIVAKIKEFQAKGGILVADAQLLPALKPDVEVPVVSFEPPPASDHTEDVNAMEAARDGDAKTRAGTLRAKSLMVEQANDLRKRLASRFMLEVDSSSPEIVTYSRSWHDTRYVFAINDHRTFGDYVGQWGLTMEKGLPYEGEVSLMDPNKAVNAVYELSRGGEVPFTREGGRVKVPVKYSTNDGRLFAFLKKRIASVEVKAPDSVRMGDTLKVTFSALDADGRPVEALLPAEIRLYDGAGREIDGAGWVCLQDGTCTVELVTNINDAQGDYKIVCRDRASGYTAERSVKVKGLKD